MPRGGAGADRTLRANALRALAIDAVQQPTPATPARRWAWPRWPWRCGAATCSTTRPTRTGPTATASCCRNGHGSMLLYALLHLSGYDLPMDELKRFRQLHSKTPGHPEVGLTPGVETTTGPLGQGIANAVGMALAEKLLADEFNRPGHTIVDHRTYVFLGDGCLMEGISHEACSLAGALALDKLIALYDDNGISIDGAVKGWFGDDTPARFEAYGWNVHRPVDGHDVAAVDAGASRRRKAAADKPTLIVCRTTIGQGSPEPRRHRQGARRAARRRGDRAARARRSAGPPRRSRFPTTVPRPGTHASAAPRARPTGSSASRPTRAAHPALAAEFARRMARRAAGRLRGDAAQRARACRPQPREAGRHAQGLAGGAGRAGAGGARAARRLGRPDRLEPHRLPRLRRGARRPGRGGNHMHYGVREFGMAAIMNGVALHGGFIPYGGTFLTFSDYCRNAHAHGGADEAARGPRVHARLDRPRRRRPDAPAGGACGQPAADPDLDVWRPGDATETAVAWREALLRARRARVRCCCRARTCRPQARSPEQVLTIRRGGYVLSDAPSAVRGDPRHRLRGGARHGTRSACSTPATCRCAWSRCPSSTVFDRQDSALPRRGARPRHAAHRRGGRHHPLVGPVRLPRRAGHRQLRRIGARGRPVCAFRPHRRRARRRWCRPQRRSAAPPALCVRPD